ncbi:hypothetical protein LCGC14_0236170 [marine sediment metagenome]|uniref:Uncharacterized protein n=1 Tax=marine sediment metagenome TaxID=412755 RepID=A0A0F9WTZ4_9ZZZZ
MKDRRDGYILVHDMELGMFVWRPAELVYEVKFGKYCHKPVKTAKR